MKAKKKKMSPDETQNGDPDTAPPLKTDKKPRRNKSAAEQRLMESCQEGEKTTCRFSIIRCDLTNAMKGFDMKRKFLQHFDSEARTQGSYRLVVGWIANYIMLRAVEYEEALHEIDKPFFDRIWSALDRAVINKKTGGVDAGNSFTSSVEEFLENSGVPIGDLPDPVPFELRSPTTRDMATVAINSIVINFQARLRAYILFRVANCASTLETTNEKMRRLATRITNLAMKGNLVLPESLETDSTIDRNALEEILRECGSVILPLIPIDPRCSIEASLRKNAHLLMPFLHFISSTFEENRTRVREVRKRYESHAKNLRRGLTIKDFRKEGLLMNGIPFSLLPSWKLQAVFVDYAETQLETMFGKSFKDMRIFEKVFSVSRLKGRKHQDWAMSGFRTN
jgi:hypothetical protein